MKKAQLYFASTLCGLSVGVGCGGSGAPPESEAPDQRPASLNLCHLLAIEEIVEVMGETPGEPASSGSGLGDCSWPAPDDSEALVSLRLSPSRLKSYDDFVTDYGREFGGEDPSKDYYRPIDDVGDWALYLKDDEILRVYTGDRMLQVQVRPPGQERAVALAKRAVPRLP